MDDESIISIRQVCRHRETVLTVLHCTEMTVFFFVFFYVIETVFQSYNDGGLTSSHCSCAGLHLLSD